MPSYGSSRGGGGGFRGRGGRNSNRGRGGRGRSRNDSGPRLPDDMLLALRNTSSSGPSGTSSMQMLSRKNRRKQERRGKASAGPTTSSSSSSGKRRREESDGAMDASRKRRRPGQEELTDEDSEEEEEDYGKREITSAASPAASRRRYVGGHLEGAVVKGSSKSVSARGGSKGPTPEESDSNEDEDDEDADEMSDIEDDLEDDASKSGGGVDISAEDALAAASDEALIRRLEKKLGINRPDEEDDAEINAEGDVSEEVLKRRKAMEKARAKMNREFAKDGLGDDFGTYLDSIGKIEKAKKTRTPAVEDDDDDDIEEADEDDDEEEEEEEEGTDDEEDTDEEEDGRVESIPEGDLEDEDEEEEEEDDEEEEGYDDVADSDEEDDGGEEEEESDDDEPAGERKLHQNTAAPSISKKSSISVSSDSGKYVPPHLRKKLAREAAAAGGDDDEEEEEEEEEGGKASRKKKASLYAPSRSSSSSSRTFVDPSHILASSDAEKVLGLRRRMQGLLNRLGDANVESLSADIAALYRLHGTNESNAVLATCIVDACDTPVQVLRPLMRVYGALVSALHISVGPSVGAFMVEYLTVQLAKKVELPLSPTITVEELQDSSPAFEGRGEGLVQKKREGRVSSNSSSSSSSSSSEAASSSDSDAVGKVRNNLLLLLCYLYAFQVAHADLLCDILRLLSLRGRSSDSELLLLALQHVGFLLRAEEPAALKSILEPIHFRTNSSLSSTSSSSSSSSASSSLSSSASSSLAAPVGRDRVIMDLILDLKNNRQRPDIVALLQASSTAKKWLQSLARKTAGVESIDRRLRVSWVDVMNVPVEGRWWLLGASWAGKTAAGEVSLAAASSLSSSQGGRGRGGSPGSASAIALSSSGARRSDAASFSSSSAGAGGAAAASATTPLSAEEAALLDIAIKMRMNTPTRRAIFLAIMGAEDADSALERVMNIRLRGSAEREIVRVLLECAAQEKLYNAYYAAVADKLCRYHPSFKFTLQLAYWDTFKVMGEATPRKLYNLARLLAHLITSYHLSLATIKVLDLTSEDPRIVLFLKALLNPLLLIPSDDVEADLGAIFSRLGKSADKIVLRDGLLLFLHEKVTLEALRGSTLAPPGTTNFKERLKFAKRALESVSST